MVPPEAAIEKLALPPGHTAVAKGCERIVVGRPFDLMNTGTTVESIFTLAGLYNPVFTMPPQPFNCMMSSIYQPSITTLPGLPTSVLILNRTLTFCPLNGEMLITVLI